MITYHENLTTKRVRVSNLPVTLPDRAAGWVERHDAPPRVDGQGNRIVGPKYETRDDLMRLTKKELVERLLAIQSRGSLWEMFVKMAEMEDAE